MTLSNGIVKVSYKQKKAKKDAVPGEFLGFSFDCVKFEILINQ